MGDSNAAVEDYKSSLADLKFNSKPLINMLTMLAEENAQYAQLIVQAIENHLQQVEASKKLPAFYLMDSINKNLPESTNYKKLFAQNIVSVFVAVFEKVDEKTRQSLYKLRQTWNDIFPQKKLYALDVRVNQIDPAWPITASPPQDGLASIHVNPKFLKQTSGIETENNSSSRRSSIDDHPQFSPPSFSPHSPEDEQKQLQQQLLQKQQELVRLQQERLEVELAAAKAKLETQTKLLQQQVSATQQSSKGSSDRAGLPSAGGTHHNTSNKSAKRSREDDERTKHSSGGRSRSSRQDTKDDSPSSKHSRINDRRAASARDITPTVDIVGEIIGHSSTGRSRTPDDPRKRSDSPFATPANKKRRGDEAAENEFDMSHLRSRTSRSDSNVSDPSSPAHNRWAVFKKERPEEFPIAQSPLLKTPPILLDRRRPHLLPSSSDDRDAFTNGGDSLQNRLRDLVMQAEKDVSIGRISEKEYTKVMSSLRGLLAMQDDDSTNDASTASNMLRADPRLRRGTGGVPADKTVLWSMAGQVENGSKLPNAYGSPMGRIPRRNKTLLPDVPPPPRPPLLSLDLGQQNAHDQLPMTLYEPEMDERWAARAKKLSEPGVFYEFVINDRSFSIGMTGPATARRVKFDSHVINVEVNPNTGELFFNGEYCYRIGSMPREHFFGGDHLTVYFQGPVKKMWFDREEYILRIDGPPKRLILAGHDVDIRLDSKLDSVLVNGKPLCPLLDGATHIVTMWGEQHEVTFVAPLKDIAINGEVCTLDASGPYPVVLIKGEAHGICFKGPDRTVVIDGASWSVPTRGVRWCKIFGPIGRPCALALGGPGHELIIDDMWYEIKFIGVAKTITIGTRTLSVMLPRPAPEVEILGVVAMKDEDLYPRPSLLPKPLLAWPADERGEEFMDVDVKAPFGSRGVPSLMAKDYSQYMTPAGYDQTSQQGAMYNDYSSTYPQQQFGSNAPASMDAGLQSSASQVNVHDLLAKLVNQGIIGTSATPSSSVKTEVAGATTDDTAMDTDADADEVVLPGDIPDLTEFKSDKLKVKYPSSVQLLYSGTACATCGIRFRRKQDVAKYREHLDWHFRQNKRGKDELKVAKFRRWYYASGDWVQYEEMGDLEEKSRSQFFETMLASVQQQLQHSYNMAAVVQPSSCPAAEGDDTCVMCGEQFEQFWDEEEDEWHLRDAVRIDGKTYHPVCYEDAKDAGANGSIQGDEEAEGDGDEMDKNKLSDAPLASSASSETPLQQSTDSVAAESTPALTSLEQGSGSESINTVVPIVIKPKTPPRSEHVDVVHSSTVATSADCAVSVKCERTSITASDIGDSVVGVSDVSNPIGQGHGNGEAPLARPEGAANTAAVIKTEHTDPVSDENTHKE